MEGGGGRRLANVDLKINLRCPIDFFCYCSLQKIYYLEELWAIIFSYLSLNGLMQISCACKMFYGVARKFLEKIDHPQRKCRLALVSYYEDRCMCFSHTLASKLKDCVCKRNLNCMRFIVKDKSFHSIFPFRVGNHIFLCTRHRESYILVSKTHVSFLYESLYLHISTITCLYKQMIVFLFNLDMESCLEKN